MIACECRRLNAFVTNEFVAVFIERAETKIESKFWEDETKTKKLGSSRQLDFSVRFQNCIT